MLVLPFPVSQVLGNGCFSAQLYIVLMWKNKKKREVPLGQAVFFDATELEITLERYSRMWYLCANGGKEGRKAERKEERCGQSVPYLGKKYRRIRTVFCPSGVCSGSIAIIINLSIKL